MFVSALHALPLVIVMIACRSAPPPPPSNTAPVTAPPDHAPAAPKCYDETACENIGTCGALCEGTPEACHAKCVAETCPEIRCKAP